jgi:hypothetical protein
MDVMRRRGRKLLAPSADCRCAQLVDTQRAERGDRMPQSISQRGDRDLRCYMVLKVLVNER